MTGLPLLMLVGGLTLFALALWQLATGLRWIKLPPKNRVKIHRWTGIALVVVACFHAPLGLMFLGVLPLPPGL